MTMHSITSNTSEIEQSCARALWALAWSQAMDVLGHSDKLAGRDVYDFMPPIPGLAHVLAARVVALAEHRGGGNIHALYAKAKREPLTLSWHKPASEDRFGECLAYMALGHGVSWYDDHPEFLDFRGQTFDVPDVCAGYLDMYAEDYVRRTRGKVR